MSEWRETILGNIISYVNRGISPKYVESNGEIVINQKCIRIGRINLSLSKQTDKCKSICQDKILRSGDILINSTGVGTAGRVAFFQDNIKATVDSHVSIIRINAREADPVFTFYNLRSREADIESFAEGSTGQIELGRERIKLINIFLPPIPEQRAIAAVLSSLDDKIDLLHRQNKTLEAMAETLFQQWFFEEPNEEWETKPLSSIAKFLNGLACQNYLPENDVDKLPVLKIRELSNGISDDSDWATNKIDKEYIVQNGDLIFAWSASLMVKLWDGGTCVLNQHLFKVTSAEYPKWFYLMWCKKHLDEFITIAQTHATTMGHIKRGDLDAAMVIIPPKEIMVQMTGIMSPIIEKQIENSKQIKVLKNLRDTLLPKLMSGEVRVEL